MMKVSNMFGTIVVIAILLFGIVSLSFSKTPQKSTAAKAKQPSIVLNITSYIYEDNKVMPPFLNQELAFMFATSSDDRLVIQFDSSGKYKFAIYGNEYVNIEHFAAYSQGYEKTINPSIIKKVRKGGNGFYKGEYLGGSADCLLDIGDSLTNCMIVAYYNDEPFVLIDAVALKFKVNIVLGDSVKALEETCYLDEVNLN
jgi:hypothetical protein